MRLRATSMCVMAPSSVTRDRELDPILTTAAGVVIG